MTNTPTHYFNFKPCDAVQYDSTWSSLNPVAEWFEETSYVISMNGRRVVSVAFLPWDNSRRQIRVEATPGQWLIRQDGKVWAQDEEPPRVKEWEYAKRPHNAASGRWFKCEGDKATHRRPVLSNGWEGPGEA